MNLIRTFLTCYKGVQGCHANAFEIGLKAPIRCHTSALLRLYERFMSIIKALQGRRRNALWMLRGRFGNVINVL